MHKKTGLYIHIPFCVKKCNYCAFLSFCAEPELRSSYVDALVKEIGLRASAAGCENGRPDIDTIYIGGGTPSLLDVSQLSNIMQAVRSSFRVKPEAEITIEANPGTLGAEEDEILAKLTAYRSMGLNRLSMGVQSMDDDRLRFLGRIHDSEDVVRDVRLAREAGFGNINLDLIFSVPGESTEDALLDAERIIGLGPEHISCYSLQIEEGTPFCRMIENEELEETSDEEDRETYHRICRRLRKAGYEHYEISNFAKIGTDNKTAEPDKAELENNDVRAPGFGDTVPRDSCRSEYRSRHNSLYWDMSDYIACGLGASGFTKGIRYRNSSDIEEYISLVSNGNLPTEEESSNSSFDNISEAVFTGLRRREGITYAEACRAYAQSRSDERTAENEYSGYGEQMSEDTGCDCDAQITEDAERFFWGIFSDAKAEAAEYAAEGLLMIDRDGLRLSEQGIDISNQIMALFV